MTGTHSSSERTSSGLSGASRCLVVVSYYDQRSDQHLHRLLASMAALPAGAPFEVAVIVNRTGQRTLQLPQLPYRISIEYRENLGMNIGAWDHGWRRFPDYDFYLFLQDECRVVQKDWLVAFLQRAADPQVGLVGESSNAGWDAPWDYLAQMHQTEFFPDHFVDNTAAPRVAVYLDFMQRTGIPPGQTGRHLRSLVWAARRPMLEAIGGFPIGRNYGECIGAEIGVSRMIESLGRKVVQVADAPFHYIRHAGHRGRVARAVKLAKSLLRI